MSADRDPIRVERDGDVAVVVLDDPPLNLFRERTLERLEEARAEVAGSGARALVFRAEGEIFTGGVDVNLFAAIPDGAAGKELAARGLHEISAFGRLEIPTIALVHGLCLTAGFEAALACDLIWADEGARFGLVERVVGLTPFGGGVQRLAERAGPGRARELVMSGRLYEAAELERWGVVNRVLPGGELLGKGMAFARDLAAGPTVAHAATKRIIRAWSEGGVAGADAETAAIAGPLFDTEDLRGAVRSFLDEGPGKASFEGR